MPNTPLRRSMPTEEKLLPIDEIHRHSLAILAKSVEIKNHVPESVKGAYEDYLDANMKIVASSDTSELAGLIRECSKLAVKLVAAYKNALKNADAN